MKIRSLFIKITLSGLCLVFFSNLAWASEPINEPSEADPRSSAMAAFMPSSSSEVLDPAYVESNLEFCPGQRANVTLPFPYGGRPNGISDDEIKVLTETAYAVLSDKSREIAFVGTLRPCVMVALRDESAGTSIVIHKHRENSMADIVELIHSHISSDNWSNLSGVLFTATPPSYNPAFFQGRTHKEELDHIKNYLVTGLEIKIPEQIKSKIITATTDDWSCPYKTGQVLKAPKL